MWPFKMTEELTVSGRFANVPFANILCRSAEKRNEHVHASFPQPRYKKKRYACTYLVLSVTDQAKAVREPTQLDADETTRRRNDSKPNWPIILDESQLLIRRKQLGNRPNLTLTKRLVGETTVNRIGLSF